MRLVACVLILGIAAIPAMGAAIGPDAFGYRLFPNSDPGGVPYSFVDIRGTGTNLNLTDDSSSGELGLPTSFSFYGTVYNSFYASSNGFVSFGSGSSSLSNQNLPSSTAPNNLIAVVWDDLLPSGSDNVYWQYFPDSPQPNLSGPVTVIQWSNVPYYSGGGMVNAELLLVNNTNTFVMQFATVGQGGSSSTTGMENSTGTVGLTYAVNQTGTLTAGLTVCGTTGAACTEGEATVPEPGSFALLLCGLTFAALGKLHLLRRQ